MRPGTFEMASAVTVDASADTVWKVITDAQRWPDWCRVCTAVSVVPETWSPGEALSFKLRMAGTAAPFNVRLTDVEPGRRVAWTSTKFTITALRTISLEQSGEGVIVTDHKRFSSPVIPVGVWYPRFLIRRMTESWLDDLNAEAERIGAP